MKKFILAFALLIGVASFNSQIQAQHINISINIGSQPAWGPTGYDYVGYYYFPDIDCYYDVNLQLFYFLDRGRWVSARYLPYAYRNYNLYNMYKVVLNVNNPWRYHSAHYRDYARYRGYRPQPVIRDSRDYRYRDSRNNRVVWYSNKKSDYRYDNNRGKDNNHNNKVNNNSRPNNNYDRKQSNNGRSEYKNNNNSRPANNNQSTGRNNSNVKKESSRQSNNANLRLASSNSNDRSGARSSSRR